MAGLFDLEFHEKKIKEYQPTLAKLDLVIDWEMFRETIEKALYVETKGAGGRPPFDKIMMFKIVLRILPVTYLLLLLMGILNTCFTILDSIEL